jgi:hypothetical protein
MSAGEPNRWTSFLIRAIQKYEVFVKMGETQPTQVLGTVARTAIATNENTRGQESEGTRGRIHQPFSWCFLIQTNGPEALLAHPLLPFSCARPSSAIQITITHGSPHLYLVTEGTRANMKTDQHQQRKAFVLRWLRPDCVRRKTE